MCKRILSKEKIISFKFPTCLVFWLIVRKNSFGHSGVIKFVSKTADPLNDFAGNHGKPFFFSSSWSFLSVKSKPVVKPEMNVVASLCVLGEPSFPIKITISSSCSIVLFFGISILFLIFKVEVDFWNIRGVCGTLLPSSFACFSKFLPTQ